MPFNAAVLASIGLVTFPAQPQLIGQNEFWQTSAGIAAVANIFFLAGHPVRAILSDEARRSKAVVRFMFGAACCMSLAVAVVAVAGECYPGL